MELEALVRAAADGVGVGLMVWRMPEGEEDPAELVLLWLNSHAVKLLGLGEPDVLIGRRFGALFPPGVERAREDGLGDAALAGRTVRGAAIPWTDPTGAVRWFEREGTPLPDRHVAVLFRDVTVQRHAEADAALFRDVVRHMPAGVLVLELRDPAVAGSWRLVAHNDAAQAAFPVPLEALRERDLGEVMPDRVDAPRTRIYHRALETGEVQDLGEFYIPEGAAHTRPGWYTGRAFPLPGARVGIGFFDITERKRAEREILEMQAQLAEHARQLARSNEELQRFAHVASHDLQEPIRVVATYADLFAGRYADRLDPASEELLEAIHEGTMRMRHLVRDLLAYTRLDPPTLERQPVDLGELMQEVLQDLEVAVDEAGAQISWTDLPRVQGEASQLRQVLQNLVANSLKYRSEDPPRITVSAAREGSMVVVEVRDNGIGFEMAYASQLFEPFTRLHGPGDYPGTGIGLAVCKKVVERHGGRIWARSAPGRGATFRFTLPDPT